MLYRGYRARDMDPGTMSLGFGGGIEAFHRLRLYKIKLANGRLGPNSFLPSLLPVVEPQTSRLLFYRHKGE